MGGLLLFEEPLLHECHALGVLRRYEGESLDEERLSLNGALIVVASAEVVAPIHAHLIAEERALLEAAHQFLGYCGVAIEVKDLGKTGGGV